MQQSGLDIFLPAHLRDGGEVHRRARLLAGTTALLAIVGVFFASQTASAGNTLQTWVLLGTSALCLGNIAALHRGLGLPVAAMLTCFEGMVALAMIAHGGVGVKDA